MFGIGGFEFFIIIVFAFLIIGPDKFPELAKSAGKFVSKFRSAKNEMDKVIKTEVYDPNAEDPFQAPIDTLQKMSKTVEQAKSGESFAQRKARYEAQRAAERKAAGEESGAAGSAGAAQGAQGAQGAAAGFSPAALYERAPVAAAAEASATEAAAAAPVEAVAPAAAEAAAVAPKEGE